MTFDHTEADIFKLLAERLSDGQSLVMVSVLGKEGFGPARPGFRMLVQRGERIAGTVGGGGLELEAIRVAAEIEKSGGYLDKEYVLKEDGDPAKGEVLPMVCGGKVRLYFEKLGKGAHVYVFGAGHVGRALVDHLVHLPFRVTVVDTRPEYIEGYDVPDAAIAGDGETLFEQVNVPEGACFVVVTHSHDIDLNVIRSIYKHAKSPRYVGAIASASKAVMFREKLHKELGDGFLEDIFYSPVGLSTGGKTAADIAVSILAQIQVVRHEVDEIGHVHLTGKTK